MTIEQITREWMEARRVEIIERQRALNMRASGRSAESLEVVEKPGNVSLLGDESLYFQEYGRGPSRRKGPIPLHILIRQWMKDKGLVEKGGFNAFAIANKIHAEGTRIHRGEAQPLGIGEIVDKNLPQLENDLALSLVRRIESDILRKFKIDK